METWPPTCPAGCRIVLSTVQGDKHITLMLLPSCCNCRDQPSTLQHHPRPCTHAKSPVSTWHLQYTERSVLKPTYPESNSHRPFDMPSQKRSMRSWMISSVELQESACWHTTHIQLLKEISWVLMLERFTKSLVLLKGYLNLNLFCVFVIRNIQWCTATTTFIVLQKYMITNILLWHHFKQYHGTDLSW